MAKQSWLIRSGRLLVLGMLLLQMPGLSSQEAKKQNLSPDEVIKAFSAKETEFYEAWMQYSYRQIAEVKVVSVDGRPSRERLSLVSEIIFKDDGTREVKLVQKRG